MVAPRAEIPADGPMTLDMDTHVYWRPEGGGAFLGQGLPEEPSEPAEDGAASTGRSRPSRWTPPVASSRSGGTSPGA